MIWCINMLVSAITSLRWVDTYFDDWMRADAMVIAVNGTSRGGLNDSSTNSNPSQILDDSIDPSYYYYCGELNFLTEDGENITTVSDTICSNYAENIPVGASLVIMYNPEDPEEIIEEELYSNGGDSLRLTVGVTVFFAVFYLICGIYMYRSQPAMVPMIGFLSDEDANEAEASGESAAERGARIVTKFHAQTVLEDMSNTTATSIRADDNKIASSDASTSKMEGGSSSEGGEDDDDAVVQNPTTAAAAAAESTWSLAGATNNILSSWRKPSRDDECCICMETYSPGEVICVAKTTECDHVFHQDCISSWLQKNHDCCPLCRIDLMK